MDGTKDGGEHRAGETVQLGVEHLYESCMLTTGRLVTRVWHSRSIRLSGGTEHASLGTTVCLGNAACPNTAPCQVCSGALEISRSSSSRIKGVGGGSPQLCSLTNVDVR